jgi:hypothetical protein
MLLKTDFLKSSAETHSGASLPCGHLEGYAVAVIVWLRFTTGACGFCHLRVPVGGAAYRILVLISNAQ